MQAAMRRVSPLGALRQKPLEFGWRQIAPLTDFEIAEPDVDDAHAAQLLDAIAELGRHETDLPVEALRKNDAKTKFSQFINLARLGHLAVDAYAARHAGDEL